MLNLSKLLIVVFVLHGCQYKEPEETAEDAVQMQVVGSYIEGMTLCHSEGNCKKTDINGMVSFEKLGTYAFKINEMYVGSFDITQDKTVISPYKLYSDETMAHDAMLMIHTFDKGEDPRDSSVLLYLSTYVPQVESLEAFINANKVDDELEYSTNDLTHTVNFSTDTVLRDCNETTCYRFSIDIATKEAYARLDEIVTFITLAEDKNVVLGEFETKYTFQQETLTSFILGESYRYRFYAKEDKVMVDIYDASSQVTDTVELLESVAPDTITTTLNQLHIVD